MRGHTHKKTQKQKPRESELLSSTKREESSNRIELQTAVNRNRKKRNRRNGGMAVLDISALPNRNYHHSYYASR